MTLQRSGLSNHSRPSTILQLGSSGKSIKIVIRAVTLPSHTNPEGRPNFCEDFTTYVLSGANLATSQARSRVCGFGQVE